MAEVEDDFNRILRLRIAATNAWKNELIRSRNMLLTANKKNELTPFIDILEYWEALGKYLQQELEN